MTDQVLTAPTNQAHASPISFQDYLKLYDGQHAEWLMGEVLVHMASNDAHQRILGFLAQLLGLFLGLKKLGKFRLAPFSMYVGDNQPAREPDLVIILNEHLDRIKPTFMDGAADIAIEIVSPESTRRDYGDKFAEYEAARVREYWIIDPERNQADIHVLGENGRYSRHALDEKGRLVSTLLEGFALDPTILWVEEPPEGIELLNLVSQMTGVKLS